MFEKESNDSRLRHHWRESCVRFMQAFFEPERRMWQGDAQLWKVFWGYGVLASAGLALLYVIALEQEHVLIEEGLLIFLAAYTVWILVSVWRCADNSLPHWATLARALTIAWGGNTILVLTFLQANLLAAYMGR
jgi:hypothetical protein